MRNVVRWKWPKKVCVNSVISFFHRRNIDESDLWRAFSLAFDKPVRTTDIRSWHGHIPFAFFLVSLLKPRLFVELGTHKGDSYSAFCQAVDTAGIECGCFAVDTWKGDDQAGYYGDEVYEELRLFNKARYGSFSELVRSSFEEALPQFADGSIDLLHIDGRHGYGDVKRDFESWLPKMSEKGFVLLHDIEERGPDFGVWKLWEEISGKYPHFGFRHSHGLGVLGIGRSASEELGALFDCGDREKKLVADFFAALGENIALGNRIEELENSVEMLQKMAATHRKMIENRDARIETLEKRLAAEFQKKRRDVQS